MLWFISLILNNIDLIYKFHDLDKEKYTMWKFWVAKLTGTYCRLEYRPQTLYLASETEIFLYVWDEKKFSMENPI